MKKARVLLAMVAISLAAAACNTPITAPDCEADGTCTHLPDSNSFHLPDSNS